MLRRILGLMAVSSALACSSSDGEDSKQQTTPWQPGVVYPTPREANSRGLVDRRGLIHAHSVHSHDACDGAPRDAEGAVNASCLESFRHGICRSRHDFVMLTDHDTHFSEVEYPDALLFDSAKGDELLERESKPVANWLACAEQDSALVLAGCEQTLMPVGLESHVADSQAGRSAVYSGDTAADVLTGKDHGAVTLVAHTENWTPEALAELPIDGFEMFNLHANAILGAGAAIGLISKVTKAPEELPYSDLVFLPLVSEDPRYIETWGSVLASGTKRVTTLGTDCHENTFPQILPDGERIDGYRRMMGWFSNHLLVTAEPAGGWDDRALKDALRAGRLYGAFEVLGFPAGFDFHAEKDGAIVEMGGDAAVGAELVVKAPVVENLDAEATSPEITVRLLRAKSGGWDLVDESVGDLASAAASAGAYRVEVRIKPRHLLAYLSSYADLAEKDFVWIYSNPIYVK